jgi:hypothetical protein
VLDVAGLASAPLVIALVALYSLPNPLSTAGVRTLLPRLVPPGGLGALFMGRVRMAGRERLVIAGGLLAVGFAICPVASFFSLAGRCSG